MAKVEKKLVKSKSGYRMVTVDERIASPFTIEEPPWTPDYSCTTCQNGECRVKFDFLKRKHHCRRCGKCFCADCCSSLTELPRMCFIDPVRHCKGCVVISKRESEFFDKHLKTLLDGGMFRLCSEINVDDDDDDLAETPSRTCVCKLSMDHSVKSCMSDEYILLSNISVMSYPDLRFAYLEFTGDTQEQENIAVQKIVSVEVNRTEQEGQAHGITIHYSSAAREMAWVKLEVDDTSGQRQQSVGWLAAMVKAFKLLQGSQRASSSP